MFAVWKCAYRRARWSPELRLRRDVNIVSSFKSANQKRCRRLGKIFENKSLVKAKRYSQRYSLHGRLCELSRNFSYRTRRIGINLFIHWETSTDYCQDIRKQSNQSINILFYVCSHRGDIRQKQKQKTKHIIIIYTHRTMNNRFNNISNNISIKQNISYIVVSI